MSEYMHSYDGWELPEIGVYKCMDFKKYWNDEHAHPFLIRYDGEIAGFAIVDNKGSSSTTDYNMAQFFILRKFKGKGVGQHVAFQCFERFSGHWEVMVMPGNDGAYSFWLACIKKYTKNNFTEHNCTVPHLNHSEKNIFKFQT